MSERDLIQKLTAEYNNFCYILQFVSTLNKAL